MIFCLQFCRTAAPFLLEKIIKSSNQYMETFSSENGMRICDRIRGCLVGCALGDTVGLYTEGLTPEIAKEAYGDTVDIFPFPAIDMFKDQHRSKFVKGSWTDDTDQLLVILLAWLHQAKLKPAGLVVVSPSDFGARLKIWKHQGLACIEKLPFGLGRTVGAVLAHPSFEANPHVAAREVWEKSGRTLAANGAVMRTAVCGLLVPPRGAEEGDLKASIQFSLEMALVTHNDRRCLISCGLVTGLVAALVHGKQTFSEQLLQHILQLTTTLVDEKLQVLGITQDNDITNNNTGISWMKPPSQIHLNPPTIEHLDLGNKADMGYTYKCLGSGMWSLHQLEQLGHTSDSFQRIITKITMAAGDADTNGAVAGALLGASLGYSQLPKEWMAGLLHHDWLVSKADAVSSLLGYSSEVYDGDADLDTLPDGGKGIYSDQVVMELFQKFTAHQLGANSTTTIVSPAPTIMERSSPSIMKRIIRIFKKK